ncbi:MAG: hypothetical protein LBI76_09495 [Comamonas sp.]|jgi:hypothetical protein|nr:hypothetical protein [Comamonas sp.]
MTTPLKAVAAGGNSAELREWVAGDFLPVANGGTGATTAAAARSNLGLGAAAVAAILGTVSQSGGVPTGAIFQTGSNANGEFIRFASGWQICTLSESRNYNVTLLADGLYYDSQAWNYPAAFIAAPVTQHSVRISGRIVMGSPSDLTSTSAAFFAISGASISGNGVTRHLAIGRWFQ